MKRMRDLEKGRDVSDLRSEERMPMAKLDRGESVIHVWDVVDRRPDNPGKDDE